MRRKKDEHSTQKQLEKDLKNSPEKKKATIDENQETENPFDFGGLPKRDLKKNLGCG